MSRRPAVVAFDVIETLMSLEPLRARLTDIGQPPGLLEAWYTRTLRDGMALSATGDYVGFADVAEAALRGLTHYTLSDEQVAHIMAGFNELPAFPDALPAVRRLADVGQPGPQRFERHQRLDDVEGHDGRAAAHDEDSRSFSASSMARWKVG